MANKLQEDHSASEEAQRYFAEVESRQFIFDRAEQEAAQMRALPHSALLAWVRDTIIPGGKACKRLSVFVHPGKDAPAGPGQAGAGWAPLPAGAFEVSSLEEFKASLRQYKHEARPVPPLEADSVE